MMGPPIKPYSLSVRKFTRAGITKHLILGKNPNTDFTDFSGKPPVLARLAKLLFVVLKSLIALQAHTTVALLN